MSGPWPASDSLHVSPIGLVPKGHDGVTWRMIVDLSYPRGQSVNDCIPSNLCSLSYPSVDDAVDYVMELGRFTQMVKLDLKSAYRILPIHPCDRSVLGVSWEGQVYLDHCLPFGLCSAPKIFTAFADVLAWILHQAGVRHIIHYLDDFLLFGSPLSDEGSWALTTALGTLAELRIPVSLPKLEGPSTTVTFLGIVLDSARLELSLPPDKVERIGSGPFLVREAVWSPVRLGVLVGPPLSCSCGGQAWAHFPPATFLPIGKSGGETPLRASQCSGQGRPCMVGLFSARLAWCCICDPGRCPKCPCTF